MTYYRNLSGSTCYSLAFCFSVLLHSHVDKGVKCILHYSVGVWRVPRLQGEAYQKRYGWRYHYPYLGFTSFLPSLLAVCSVLLSKLSRMQLLSLFLAFYDCFNLQQQFAIGVNDVTRVLERMQHSVTASHSTQRSSEAPTVSGRRQAPLVPLQVHFSFLVCCWCTSIGSLQWNCISISIVCIYEVEGSGFLVAACTGLTAQYCTILFLSKRKTSSNFFLNFGHLQLIFCYILWYKALIINSCIKYMPPSPKFKRSHLNCFILPCIAYSLSAPYTTIKWAN